MYTFTNGATGNIGHTISNQPILINTSLEGSITIATQGFQEWTVPTPGIIIEAFGASGREVPTLTGWVAKVLKSRHFLYKGTY